MFAFLNDLITIISSSYFVLLVVFLSITVKATIARSLLYRNMKPLQRYKTGLFLLLIFSCITTDFAWVSWLANKILFSGNLNNTVVILFTRIAWAFTPIQYATLGHLAENSISRERTKRKMSLYLKIFSLAGAAFGLFFIYKAIFAFGTVKSPLELQVITFVCLYELLLIPHLVLAFRKVQKASIPRLLKRQVTVLILRIFFPFIMADFIHTLKSIQGIPNINLPGIYSITTMVLTGAIYFSSKKIMGLRFLNIKEHVEAQEKFNFLNDFRTLLEQLGTVTTVQEITHISRTFFKNAFEIPYNRTHVFMRPIHKYEKPILDDMESSIVESSVENFLSISTSQNNALEILQKKKIFIADELAFDNFYEETDTHKAILNLLDNINADIFLPIYNQNNLIAYIIIEQEARKKQEFYNNVERDEMIVFASHLGNIINLLQNKNLDALLVKEKHMTEELHYKNKEISHYKESIRSFMRNTRDRKIGIIFYKNRRFVFGNTAAQDFIPININTQDGHPVTKILKNIAKNVMIYRGQQSVQAHDGDGKNIVITGIPNTEHNNVLLVIHYPEIADILREQIDLLTDPSSWDYLLYLHSTGAGKTINQFIPGNGQTLLQFKITLLRSALSDKPLLLDSADEDISSLVDCIHTISGRTKFYSLNLEEPLSQEEQVDTIIQLFGLNPIFGKTKAPALLSQANQTGTVFIRNIHHLSLDTQNQLTEYLKYGFYKLFKSDQKRISSARIICTSNEDLQTLVHKQTFSQELYNVLKKETLSMPSLLTLPKNEFLDLAEQYTEQTINTHTFKNLLILTEKDKSKLLEQRALSFHELRNRIQYLLLNKTKRNNLENSTGFHIGYSVADPDLTQAARLGKQALRSKNIMTMLWNKFKNQNKIATFLGVNRSSVSRRCKEFNLE